MWIMTVNGWRMLNTVAIPAPKDRTLLEIMGLGKRTPNAADRYCAAIDRYLLPEDHDDHIDEQQMSAIMGAYGSR